MTDASSASYAQAMAKLRETDPKSYRDIKNRVESWKTIADKWRDRAEGKPETPSAAEWRKKYKSAEYIIYIQQRRIEDLEAKQDGEPCQ